MAFPSVRSTSGGSSSNSTSPSFTLPATVVADDLIIVIAGTDSTATFTPPAGFTAISQQSASFFQCQVFGKIASGAEGGTSVSGTLSSSESSCYIALSVDGFSGNIADVAISTVATGVGTSADPSAVTATWGPDDNLFIACAIGDYYNKTASAFPTNYTSNQLTQQHSDAFGGTQAVSIASRELAAASDDPSAFTLASTPNDGYGAFTIVVKPADGGATIVQTDTTPEDGVQQTVTCTGMTGPITAATLGGYDILSLLSGTDPASPITYTLDISSLAEGTNASLPRLGVSLDLVFTTATDGAVTQSGIVIQPKTGWALVELEDTINKDANGLIATIEADTGLTVTNADALYYETANNASITVNGVYTSDLTTAGQSTKIILQDGGTSPATSYSDGFYPYGEAGGSGSKVVQSMNISSIRIGL